MEREFDTWLPEAGLVVRTGDYIYIYKFTNIFRCLRTMLGNSQKARP